MVAGQAPLSMRFPRQGYWSGLPFHSPGDLPDPGIEPESPRLAGGSFTTEPPGKPFPSIDISKVVLLRKFISLANALKTVCWDFWWSSGWGFVFPVQGGRVRFLIRELGSCIPHSTVLKSLPTMEDTFWIWNATGQGFPKPCPTSLPAQSWSLCSEGLKNGHFLSHVRRPKILQLCKPLN